MPWHCQREAPLSLLKPHGSCFSGFPSMFILYPNLHLSGLPACPVVFLHSQSSAFHIHVAVKGWSESGTEMSDMKEVTFASCGHIKLWNWASFTSLINCVPSCVSWKTLRPRNGKREASKVRRNSRKIYMYFFHKPGIAEAGSHWRPATHTSLGTPMCLSCWAAVSVASPFPLFHVGSKERVGASPRCEAQEGTAWSCLCWALWFCITMCTELHLCPCMFSSPPHLHHLPFLQLPSNSSSFLILDFFVPSSFPIPTGLSWDLTAAFPPLKLPDCSKVTSTASASLIPTVTQRSSPSAIRKQVTGWIWTQGLQPEQ